MSLLEYLKLKTVALEFVQVYVKVHTRVNFAYVNCIIIYMLSPLVD